MSGPVVFTPPLRQLVDGVSRYLAANGAVVVERALGVAHEKPIAGRANRVIFYGSKLDGTAGSIVNPRQVGCHELGADPTTDPPTPASYRVRPLSDWARQITVSIWAQDLDRPNDEGAQDDAAWSLLTRVQQAVQSVAEGNAVFGAIRLIVPTERAYGCEYQVDLAFQTMIPDVPVDLCQPNPLVNRPAP